MPFCIQCNDSYSKNKHSGNKCYNCYLCKYEGCKKTSIINNYCSKHVSFGRKKREPYVEIPITRSDIIRRETHQNAAAIIEENLEKLKDNIKEAKAAASYSNDPALKFIVLMLAENLDLAIQSENERIESEINDFLNYANMFKKRFETKTESRKSWKRSSYKEDPEAKYERTGSSTKEESDSDSEYENKFGEFVHNKYDAALTLLGLSITCRDLTEIKRAYWNKAKEYHPDKHPGEETIYNILFQDVSNAYQLLVDR